MYATPNTVEKLLEDPDTTIKLLETIKQERASRLALEAKAEEDKPKVLLRMPFPPLTPPSWWASLQSC